MAQQKSALTIRGEYALALVLLAVLQYLPLYVANKIARGVTRLLDRAVPKLRRVARKNISFAYPDWTEAQREALIDGVFASIARLLVAVARLPTLNASNVGRWIHYEGLEHYLQAKGEGRGVLVATAHLGNWELSAYTHALMTEPMNVMVRPLDNSLVDNVVESRRSGSGNTLISKKDAARRVLKALRNNEAVGILLDQNTSADEGIFVRFFDQLACANAGFVKLAYHGGVPVIPGFALWEEQKQRYVLRFYPKVMLTGNLEQDTQRIHSFLEGVIREYPDQWMWIHRRWKTRPKGEAPLY